MIESVFAYHIYYHQPIPSDIKPIRWRAMCRSFINAYMYNDDAYGMIAQALIHMM